ncbi:uncharacterized protein CBL_13477 [Carabus blaptoides fortunei]
MDSSHRIGKDSHIEMVTEVQQPASFMPQGLAYATLAGLEPQYGLYSAFMGCFVYAIFGSVREITIGPTALMALMTYQQVIGRGPEFAVLLCFLSGIVQLLMSVLHLGVLVDFISIPVTVGFTSATSVIIAVSQLKSLLGLQISTAGFLDTLFKVFQNLHETRLADCLLGLGCIAILLFLRKIKDIKLTKGNQKPTPNQRLLSRGIWLLSISRNALVVMACSVTAYFYETSGVGSPFLLTGAVRPGLPNFGPPPFSTNIGNRTLSFVDMCNELGSSIILVPVIAVLGNVAIAKAFASGQSVDATQELLTLSLSNILGSFTNSMPITGSFSRSAVNHASGVRTPMGGLFTGIMVLLALSFLTPFFAFIPKTSLAAVIICAVIFMIEYEVVKPMWKSNRKDLVPTFATFILCLAIGVELGILIGVGINLVFLLYPSARPSVNVEKATSSSGVEYLLITPGNSLYFPAIDFIRSSVGRAAINEGLSHIPVIVDCRYVLGADFTAAKGIAALIEDFSKRKQPLYFYNPRADVVAVFKGAALDDFQHITSEEELDMILQDYHNKIDITRDDVKLIQNVESANGLPKSYSKHSLQELQEIRCSSNDT